jgi:hypothetical protein
MGTTFHPKLQAAEFQPLFDAAERGMTPELAERILALELHMDEGRLEEFFDKANEGLLTPEEDAEYEAYIELADLLAIWQSTARRALAQFA